MLGKTQVQSHQGEETTSLGMGVLRPGRGRSWEIWEGFFDEEALDWACQREGDKQVGLGGVVVQCSRAGDCSR